MTGKNSAICRRLTAAAALLSWKRRIRSALSTTQGTGTACASPQSCNCFPSASSLIRPPIIPHRATAVVFTWCNIVAVRSGGGPESLLEGLICLVLLLVTVWLVSVWPVQVVVVVEPVGGFAGIEIRSCDLNNSNPF